MMFRKWYSQSASNKPRRKSGSKLNLGRKRDLSTEPLEARVLLAADSPVISEFMASNDGALLDQFGISSDWIELFNPTDQAISLTGWHLTDDADDKDKWTFPEATISEGQFMVVFASGEDVKDSGSPLHTNFKLNSGGEYLALVKPDMTVAHEFSEEYPQQFTDVSFGLGAKTFESTSDDDRFQFHVPKAGDAALGADWTAIGFDDTGWKPSTGSITQGVGFAISGSAEDFEGEIATDVAADMLINNASIWIRHSFDVADPSEIDGLLLDLNYDDGFVAYLNGVEVLSANTPEGGVEWNSEADMPRRPRRRNDDALETERFDIGEHAHLIEPGKNVFAIHGLNDTNVDPEFFLKARLLGVSMDAEVTPEKLGYLSESTPGSANRPLQGGSVDVSHDSLFFTEPFAIELSSGFANQTLRYTTDGSEVTNSSTEYTESIQVTDTVNLRAAAFTTDGAIGPVSIRTYVNLAEDSASISADLPIVVFSSDSTDLSNTARGIRKDNPVHSTVALFEPGADGLTSVNTEPTWITDASIQRRGSSTAGNPKLNLAVEFQNQSGADRDLSILGMPADSDWVFYAPYNFDRTKGIRNSLFYELANQVGQYASRTRIVQVYHSAAGESLSADDFQGVYVIIEKIQRGENRVDVEKLGPDDTTEPDITGGWIWKVDRNDQGDSGFSAGGQSIKWVNPKEEEVELIPEQVEWAKDYFNNFRDVIRDPDSTWEQVTEIIDVDSWIDHAIVNTFTFNLDAYRLSGYFHKDRGGKLKMGPVWDCDRCMGSEDSRDNDPEVWHSRVSDYGTDFFGYPWWRELYANQPNFWQSWIDRWFELREEVMSDENLASIVDTFAAQIEGSQEADTAKWRQTPNGGPFDPLGERTWEAEVRHLKGFNQTRVDWIDARFVAPVTISPASGKFVPGQQVTMDAAAGVIYYTTDGSDPRASGGDISPNAVKYEGPITIDSPTSIIARAFDDSEPVELNPNRTHNDPRSGSFWSAPKSVNLAEQAFANVSNFRITEVNYNPHDATAAELAKLGEGAVADGIDNDEFEFIEFMNISDEPIQLGGTQLVLVQAFDSRAGVEFTFADQTLEPGERVVVAENVDAFKARYGSAIKIAQGSTGEEGATDGQYGGLLENRGESLRMVDRFGELIMRFNYGDGGDWPERADGNGSSLELVDVRGDFSRGTSWRPSGQFGGSPGTSGAEAIDRLIVTEVLSSSTVDNGDKIELHNATNEPIDIAGWFISDSGQQFDKFKVADSTVIPAGGYQVYTEAELGFGFDGARGGEVVVVEADANGLPVSFAANVSFGNAPANVSLGRSPVSSPTMVHLESQTFGSDNSGPRTGEVIISEIAYLPPDPDANGSRRSRDVEFIELYNRTSAPIDVAGWQLTGDNVEFTFEENTVIDAGGTLIAVRFEPTDVARSTVFRFFYGVSADTTLYGKISSSTRNELPDERGTYRLEKAGEPTDDGFVPIFLMDEVSYTNEAPWPTSIDGNGDTLTRVSPTALGALPQSWVGTAASAGKVDFSAPPPVVGDSNGDGVFNQLDIVSVLQGAKFLTGQPATLAEGDWNGDGVFDQGDIVAALQAGYLPVWFGSDDRRENRADKRHGRTRKRRCRLRLFQNLRSTRIAAANSTTCLSSRKAPTQT